MASAAPSKELPWWHLGAAAGRQAPPPWLAALLAGALARLVAAWCSLSFVARDDYFHVLEPALHWLRDPAFDWEHSDLPGAGIRSHLLPRLVWWLLRGLEASDVTAPESQLRGLYAVMGAYSLLLVPAMYRAGEAFFDAATARRAAWVGALFFPFPYAGTRLLIEALAMPPLLMGLVLLAPPPRSGAVAPAAPRGSDRPALAAGLCLALACWWRLQVAAVLPGVAWALVRQHPGGRWRRPMLAGATGLVFGLGVEGLFDLLTVGGFLSPVWHNLQVNLHPHPGLSRSSPWGYAAFWLAMTLPPATVWLLPRLGLAARRAPLLALPWLSFVALHAAIPHKEDRFMLPVLPLFGVLLAAAWRLRPRLDVPGWGRARPCAQAFAAVLLLLALTSQSQENLRQLMLAVRADPQATGLISMGPEIQTYFLGDRSLAIRQAARPTEAFLQVSLASLQSAGTPANRVAAFARDRNEVEVMMRLSGYGCTPPQELRGWWFDRLLQALNPRRNRRRSPVLLWACEPAAPFGLARRTMDLPAPRGRSIEARLEPSGGIS